MWKKLLDSFDPSQIEDPHFGTVEWQENGQDHTYYLMKEVWLGDQSSPVSLTIESPRKESDALQFSLFQNIETRFVQIAADAYRFMATQLPEMKAEDIKENFIIESIYIGDATGNLSPWELTLLNSEEGGQYCVIDFEDLKPVHLSMEE